MTVTFSPRLALDGTVEWNGSNISNNELGDRLRRLVSEYHQKGLRVRLLFECYHDTSIERRNQLLQEAKPVGADSVELEVLSWLSSINE